MKVKQGIWTVSKGKGDRHYINCDSSDDRNGCGVMHPDQLAKSNGVGMYGYQHLKDLGVAILKFEKLINESDSILSQVNID